MGEKRTVCVTGAGGYVASWLVKLLLSNGYSVHGTVRDPQNDKNAHLKKLEKALENLKLFKVDLLDYNSLSAAITGCDGVFHVACPVPSGSVPNPEVELVEPAVKGTLNVLKACSEANVKRVVVVSSVAAILLSPDWPKGRVKDESCWSDKEYCRRTNNWYCLSKTEAESEAIEFAKVSGLDVVTVCPSLVLGPMLQPTVNSSSLILIKLLKEGYEELENRLRNIVDTRDVAEALLLAYEKPEAKGRYICTAHTIRSQDLVEILRRLYPNYNYPKKFTEANEGEGLTEGLTEEGLSSEKLQEMGWSYRPLEETLVDSIEGYREAGLLD
ncbi:cinnamoyl-CoA reductase 1-like [Rhododendron vialii]|uniref:cinnamoyl-CoA reductase 1-like n=1 Tax=Rhododendron vialii TaxID=182163 RepID=UPI00265E43DE|nr:cinnamoyl-CoA reductase 1-like [Rhododendron vialii]